jgi:hypothetical protein
VFWELCSIGSLSVGSIGPERELSFSVLKLSVARNCGAI